MSPLRFPQVSLAILAGGNAQRLGGAAKGLIEIGGQTCLEHLVSVGRQCAQTLLVTQDARYARFGLEVVADWPGVHGPWAGVFAALHRAQTELLVVTACDQPFLPFKVLERLTESAAAACCFERGGYLEPFPSLWRVREALAQLAEERLESPRQALSRLGAERVDERTLRQLDPSHQTFMVLNTPEDLARAGAKV